MAEDESAQDVFNQMVQNLMSIAQGINGETAEEMKLSLDGEGNVDINLTIAMGEQKMDMPLKASATLKGVMDSKKGAHVDVSYLADLGMLAMLL